MSIFDRTVALIGEQNMQLIKNKKIIIFGVGGVGGYVVEMLARAGIGTLTLVDFDKVSESNLNRQIIALNDNVDKFKVDCFNERIKHINPECNVVCIKQKLMPENIAEYNLKTYDYVIECIDMVTSKVALIEFCVKNGIMIISSMGTGNRFDMPKFEVCDISKTSNDGLAKAVRSLLKKKGIIHSLVVTTHQDAKKQKPVGSIAYFPAMCGITIGAYVINEILKEEK